MERVTMTPGPHDEAVVAVLLRAQGMARQGRDSDADIEELRQVAGTPDAIAEALVALDRRMMADSRLGVLIQRLVKRAAGVSVAPLTDQQEALLVEFEAFAGLSLHEAVDVLVASEPELGVVKRRVEEGQYRPSPTDMASVDGPPFLARVDAMTAAMRRLDTDLRPIVGPGAVDGSPLVRSELAARAVSTSFDSLTGDEAAERSWVKSRGQVLDPLPAVLFPYQARLHGGTWGRRCLEGHHDACAHRRTPRLGRHGLMQLCECPCHAPCPLAGQRTVRESSWEQRCACPGLQDWWEERRERRATVERDRERKDRLATELRGLKTPEIQQRLQEEFRNAGGDPMLSDLSRTSRFVAARNAPRGTRSLRTAWEVGSALRAARRTYKAMKERENPPGDLEDWQITGGER